MGEERSPRSHEIRDLLQTGHARPVSLDASDGVVTLRGELAERDDIGRLATAVRGVADVRDVVNLDHAPGPPALNKSDPLRAET